MFNHGAAIEFAGKDNGAPGVRPNYHANYDAGFAMGPDGRNIEVVRHKLEASAPGRRPQAVVDSVLRP